MKKLTAILTALTMMSASMLTVSAETTYAIGDVDMDGVITGHDTGMVSRHLNDEAYSLTDEQLSLADVDGDGEVTQADADKLYNEMQTVELGDVNKSFVRELRTISDAQDILMEYAYINSGYDSYLNTVQRNLADVDMNGTIDINDARTVLKLYGLRACGYDDEISANGVYYYSMDKASPAYIDDMDDINDLGE